MFLPSTSVAGRQWMSLYKIAITVESWLPCVREWFLREKLGFFFHSYFLEWDRYQSQQWRNPGHRAVTFTASFHLRETHLFCYFIQTDYDITFQTWEEKVSLSWSTKEVSEFQGSHCFGSPMLFFSGLSGLGNPATIVGIQLLLQIKQRLSKL